MLSHELLDPTTQAEGDIEPPTSRRPQVWFGVLGPLEIRVNGLTTRIGSPKLRILLSVLLLRAGRPVTLRELARAIWGEAQPEFPRRAVQLCVTRIRTQFPQVGQFIATCADGYRIETREIQFDLSTFESLATEAELLSGEGDFLAESQILASALNEWRGEPLADVPSELLQNEVAPRLRERRLVIFERYAHAQIELERHAEIISELVALTAQNPLRERPWALLMMALHRSGRRADALDAYHQIRQNLADELGIDPGEELQTLHLMIVTGRVGSEEATSSPIALPVPRQLPSDIRGFAGRSQQLAELDYLLQEGTGSAPIIGIITGTAGVGKSTLAVHWARRVADRFPDGQLWVNLRGYDSNQALLPGQVLERFLRALGVPGEQVPLDLADQIGLYRSLIDGRRILLLLDNAADSDQVRPLLPGGPGCMVLVTSRHQLTSLVSGEAAHPFVLDLLSQSEARQMFAHRVGADGIEGPPVDEIIELCARLPLALAIVAARAAVQPEFGLETLATQLRATRRGLNASAETTTAMLEVRAAFSWSYHALTADAANLFRLLGVHPGPDITIPALASLAALPIARVRTLLAELCEVHLLEEHQPGRYGFHDLLRAYAAELNHTQERLEDSQAAIHRLLDHYLYSAYRASLSLGPQRDPLQLPALQPGVKPEQICDHKQSIAWFSAEHTVLLAVLEKALSSKFYQYVGYFAAALSEFLSFRGFWHDWIATQEIALDTATKYGDSVEQARAHRGLTRAYSWTNQLDKAESHCQSAFALSTELGDQLGLAWIHIAFALLRERQGNQGAALEHDLQALAQFRSSGDAAWEARSLNNVGWDYIHLGDFASAIPHCNQALTIMVDLDNRFGQAAPWDTLGLAHHHLGDDENAIRCFQEALGIFREFGDRLHEAEVLTHLGDARLSVSEIAEARQAWRSALDILAELGHRDATQVRRKLRDLSSAGRRKGKMPVGRSSPPEMSQMEDD